MKEINIPCPNCKKEVKALPHLLFQGKSFKCTTENCNASISISKESLSVVKDAYRELQQLKNKS